MLDLMKRWKMMLITEIQTQDTEADTNDDDHDADDHNDDDDDHDDHNGDDHDEAVAGSSQ
jgi:hypothetical protein